MDTNVRRQIDTTNVMGKLKDSIPFWKLAVVRVVRRTWFELVTLWTGDPPDWTADQQKNGSRNVALEQRETTNRVFRR